LKPINFFLKNVIRLECLDGKQASKANPVHYASVWVNIVSQSKRRARGGSDGLSGILVVSDWARLFRGHITSEAFVE
jgi:hypothetical protein